MKTPQRLAEVKLDPTSLAATTPEAEHERQVAIFDLLEENTFSLTGYDSGPYSLLLSLADNRLVFDVSELGGPALRRIMLSLAPFRRVTKDYFMICDSYYEAIKSASPAQIEAIDMGRRALHNEGSVLLSERLAEKITVDFDTSRRLFTLVCALRNRI